ncbi:MAG: hypothetical protein RBT76_15755 [candidate division Zixibacteria bacterium]|nr:hypothetical protein [candidate division Zixibacteria bacterium]
MSTFFAFAIADSMFTSNCIIRRREIDVAQVRQLISAGVEPSFNPSHTATIAAMRARFGIDLKIPGTPPRITLHDGDRLIVMTVHGLPRLENRHQYSDDEIASANFSFAVYTIEKEA